jgi:hypothetical protein
VTKWLVLGCACIVVGCGEDAYRPEFSEREAQSSECPTGGSVLLVDGSPQMTVCNGADGSPGAPGADGAPGRDGAVGPVGATGPVGRTGEAGVASEGVRALATRVDALRANLVAIQCSDGNTIGFGSGTVSTDGTVLTAAHVAADLRTHECEVFDMDVDHAVWLGSVTKVAWGPRGRDVANLTVDWEGTPPEGLTPVQHPPALGEMVMASGHPDVLAALQLSPGFVTATGADEFGDAWSNAFLADYSSAGGGSGGAIFDSDCQWIGIHVGGFEDGLELSVALPF